MDERIKGLILSFALICAVLFFGWVIGKGKGKGGSKELSRKFVHIGVSFFYFIYARYLFGTGLLVELAMPVLFIFSNLYVSLTGKPKALSKAMSGGSRFGTVYYPIAMVILILLSRVEGLDLGIKDIGAGMLVMGVGDGFAGLTGAFFGKKKIGVLFGNKTWLGSLVMLVASFAVIMLIYGSSEWWLCAAAALFAAVVEAMTPNGLDNLTVPVLSALFCMLVM